MNDHLLFLCGAYGLLFFCMVWELIALRLRRRHALQTMRESVEDHP